MQEDHPPRIERPNRGTFLSVLCVLSFIGSGFQISNQLASYSTAAEQVAHPERIAEVYEDIETGDLPESFVAVMEDILESDLENLTVMRIKRYSLGMVVAGFFTLIGALGMWRLRRWGFHAYLAGTLAYMAIPWVSFVGLKASTHGYAAIFIGLFMILMYALNYRKLA